MTYFNRNKLLLNTLETLRESKHDNFGVLVVDDGSEPRFHSGKYPFQVNVIRIDKEDKKWKTHTPAQNIGVKKAIDYGAEVLILQNAEALHIGDVLMYTENNLTEQNYLSFACYSASKESSKFPDVLSTIHETISGNNVGAFDSEHNSWYNHPLYRGTGYDFCSAITRENMIKLNGYDERYMNGYCYSDDDLVMRIKRLGLAIDIPTDPFVVHQWHSSSGAVVDFDKLTIMNRDLYGTIANTEQGFKATHLITPDL
jgi:glycosyltransferase involved in cell wall biosynthesis